MPEGSAEIVRRMYESFHSGDAEGALAYFDPEVVIDATTRIDGGIGHGREEVGTIIGHWVGAFEDWREEIEEIRELGSRVYVAATQYGRGKGSGIEVEDAYAVLYEVRAQKIARLTLYADRAEALAAAGEPE
jgi:ketosteroid isomerase-like protein